MSRIPYASVVGSLMYIMVYTRPDLVYACCTVSLCQIQESNMEKQ